MSYKMIEVHYIMNGKYVVLCEYSSNKRLQNTCQALAGTKYKLYMDGTDATQC